MTHAYHDALPGYDPAQLLIDGCPECEARRDDVGEAIAHLDEQRFPYAWLRAADWMATTPPSGERAHAVSDAETPMLHAIWALQLHLVRLGVPLGALPTSEVLPSIGSVELEFAVPAKEAIR